MKIQKLKESYLKEDTSKEWKPNTSFKHIKDIYNKVKANNYKYVNNEREEFMAAVKKADNKSYKPEECRQIKDWHREIWQKNKKNEDIDYSQFRDLPDLIPYVPVKDTRKWQYSVGGVDVPYTSYEEAKAHLKDDYKIADYRDELQKYIDKETGRPHKFFVDETFDGRLCIDINYGDWKHEHWYADSLVKEFFMNKGLGVEIEEEVTLETGSDTYSACHYYEIDDLMLSGRVVKESLKEDLTDPSEVIEFKKQLSIVDNLDDIQELITGLSDGVAEDLVQQAFDANEMKSVGEVKSAVLSALDVYLEDNDWLGESLESNIKHIYYHNDPITGLRKGQWVDVKEENGKLYGKWSFEGDNGWYEITNIEEMPYHNFHGARPAKTFTWGGWRHWLDDEVEKFWDIEGKRISGDFEIPGMPHVKRKLEDMDESLSDYRFEVSCNDGPTKVIRTVAETEDRAVNYVKNMYAQEYSVYADDRANKWYIKNLYSGTLHENNDFDGDIDSDGVLKISPNSRMVEIDIEDRSDVDTHPIQRGLRGYSLSKFGGSLGIKESYSEEYWAVFATDNSTGDEYCSGVYNAENLAHYWAAMDKSSDREYGYGDFSYRVEKVDDYSADLEKSRRELYKLKISNYEASKDLDESADTAKSSKDYKIKFFQVFEVPKSPKETGKMIGQRGTLKDAIAFGNKRTGGRNNFLVKAICNDGTKKYVDFNHMSDDEINNLSEALNENAFTDAMKIAGSVFKNTGKAIGNSVKNSALGQAVSDKIQAVKDSDLVKNIKDDVKQTDTYKKSANKDVVNKVKGSYNNYLKGVKSAPELFFNYLQIQNKAQDINQLGILNDLSKEMDNVAKKNKINLLDTTNTIRQKINDKSISNITSKTDIQKFLTDAAYRGRILDQWNKVYSKKFGTNAVTESIDDTAELNEASKGFEKEFYNGFVILKNRAGDGWDIYSYDGTPEKVTRAYLEDEGYATLQAAKDEIDKWHEEAKLDESKSIKEDVEYKGYIICQKENDAELYIKKDGKFIKDKSGNDLQINWMNDAKKYIDNLTESKSVKTSLEENLLEASYGGAFDIADDEYFTRDDIVTASEKVLDHINETFSEEYVLGGTWFENGNWIVNVQTQDGMEEYEVEVPVSMRRIRKPSDIEKYVLEVASKLIAQIKEYNGLDEAFSGEYSDKFYSLAKDFEADDDVQALRVLADDVIRYCPEEDVKDCWYDRGYQKRQQDEEDRIAWLNSDDELDEDYNSTNDWEYQPAGHGNFPEYNKKYSDRLIGVIIPPVDEFTAYFAALYDDNVADYIYSDLTPLDVYDKSTLFDNMEAAIKHLDTEASKALNNLNIKADGLNEDYDGESEKGPKEGADAGIADLLSSAIIDEWEAIKEYNDLAINARAEGFDDVATIIDDINTEENIHVGQLQQALTTISPNATVINQGQQEARDQLSGGSANELDDKVEIDNIDDDF